MLKVEGRLEVVASLEVLQNPVEQLGMAAVRAGRPVEVHQLASAAKSGRKKSYRESASDSEIASDLLYPQTGQQREHLRSADPLPGVDEFTAELLRALDIEALRPRPLDHLLQPRDRRHRAAKRILRGAVATGA